ncbi:hypothetical protein D3C76_807380 [compost metagenome]
MGADLGLGSVVGAVLPVARFGHVAGVDAVGLHLVGVHVHQGAEVLVRRRAVVALEEVVDDVLPVGPDPVGQAMAEGQVGDVRRPVQDFVPQLPGLLAQRARSGIEVDEDEAAELFHLDRTQVDLALVEFLQTADVRCAGELAVQAVAPGVVRADDAVDLALPLQHRMRAVLADVVEGPQVAVMIAHHRDRVSGDLGGGVGAGLPDLLHMADPLPRAGNDLLLVQLEPLGIDVGIRTQGLRDQRIRVIPPGNVFELRSGDDFGHIGDLPMQEFSGWLFLSRSRYWSSTGGGNMQDSP